MTSKENSKKQVNDDQILGKAFLNAAISMGMDESDAAGIIGIQCSELTSTGIDPKSNAGVLALLLVRVYRDLYAMVSGDSENMRHWLVSPNKSFNLAPGEMMKTPEGLARVSIYLEALRAKP